MAKGFHTRPASCAFVPSPALITAAVLLLVTALEGHAAPNPRPNEPPQIASFITNKEAQARALAEKLNLKISPDVWSYFRTARTGNTAAVTNAFERLKKRSSQYEGSRDDPTVGSIIWQTLIEVEVAVDAYAEGDPKFSTAFGQGVIDSVPPGSIYFGGTDAGRGLVTALCKSHADADPFFTITQNALADGRYLDYIREMYGDKIQTPTVKDSQNAFQSYMTDAQKRMVAGQLKPGEDVRVVGNRVQVSGQVAVMSINALLVKTIFDDNTNREFYIEESFPLDWMYPHLSPHGFIFKLNREPLKELPTAVVKKDREFWTRQQAALIGDWLTPETPVKDVCDFVQKVFGRRDFSGFKGDRRFVENSYANKLYSKLRSSSAGVYQWRATTNAPATAEQKRMTEEADFAFRQAFALCPYSPEAIYRYVQLLVANERFDDAQRLGLAAQRLDPENKQLDSLTAELRRLKQAQKK